MPTRLESVEEIRAALQARQLELLDGDSEEPLGTFADIVGPPAADADAATVAPTLPQTPDVSAITVPPAASIPTPAPVAPPSKKHYLYRPTQRPPVPLLCVFDDGADDGETIRIRGERFVIGRSEGDLTLPHDSRVSSRHAEIVRQKGPDDRWVWVLTDLGSTNGTFVRAGSAGIKDGQEFLVGRTCYRFEAAPTPAAQPEITDIRKTALAWDATSGPPTPSIVEITPTGPGVRLPLTADEYWIGSDRARCALVPADDPFVSPRHARLHRDAKGRWHVSNNKAANGLWVRVEQTDLTSSCYFQLGEQRFYFKVP
jgi:hypothetical protein